jgi:Tfp pilus assembly protein PilV
VAKGGADVQQESDAGSHRESGLSLLEVLLAVGVLLIGFLALAQTVVTTHALRRNSDERGLMLSAFRVIGEAVHSVADEARTRREGWAQAVLAAVRDGERLGPTFSVRGLSPWPGGAEVGTLTVVTDETATDSDLGVRLGMPRDLDGDGAITKTDVTASASMLPVVMSIKYQGITGAADARRGFFVTRF